MILVANLSAPLQAQTADDSLRVYAANITKSPISQKQFDGHGIYLGRGEIITAAHVVGRWPFFTRPRVLIAGQDLPATIIKEGSFPELDLALLSVEEDRLPVFLRLRRNPLCKESPKIGTDVIVVNPEQTTRSRIISPRLIAPEYRDRFDTLINTEQASGSGLFDADRKCLLGIMSAKVAKYNTQIPNSVIARRAGGFAGYFVPASKIATFLPPASFR